MATATASSLLLVGKNKTAATFNDTRTSSWLERDNAILQGRSSYVRINGVGGSGKGGAHVGIHSGKGRGGGKRRRGAIIANFNDDGGGGGGGGQGWCRKSSSREERPPSEESTTKRTESRSGDDGDRKGVETKHDNKDNDNDYNNEDNKDDDEGYDNRTDKIANIPLS